MRYIKKWLSFHSLVFRRQHVELRLERFREIIGRGKTGRVGDLRDVHVAFFEQYRRLLQFDRPDKLDRALSADFQYFGIQRPAAHTHVPREVFHAELGRIQVVVYVGKYIPEQFNIAGFDRLIAAGHLYLPRIHVFK